MSADENQPRDDHGRWTDGGGGGGDHKMDAKEHHVRLPAVANHATKKAESASEKANRRDASLSHQQRADLHSDAAVEHGKAADAHVEAAKVVKKDDEKDYHHQVAAGHRHKADDHAKAAGTYATIKDASANLRHLHVCGATSQSRTEMLDGREYLVVPVIALMEGVIHAVNADTPEFVPLATLRKAASTWNGRPVVLGHPTKNGTQCSANAPDIEVSHRIGTIFNSRVEGTKLLQEAWIEKAKAKRLNPTMYERLEANKTEEVSVGAHVLTGGAPGEHNGRTYRTAWLETTGDHLAFLPGGRGACSIEMGCGTHRAAMHFVTAEGFKTMDDFFGCMAFTTLKGQSLDERMQAVHTAVNERWPMNNMSMPAASAYALQVFDDRVIVRMGDETYSVSYKVENGKVVLGDPTKVVQKWVAAARAKYEDCTVCKGSGNVGGNPCDACEGEGELKAAAGARHSASDTQMIQTVHDHAVSLGAGCDRKNLTTAAAANTAERIRHEGGRWVLYSKDNTRRLGAHDTKCDAEEHERAIERSMASKAAS